MKIDRVILSTNEKKEYYDFWPLVSQRWKNWGITPELFVISDKDLEIDNAYGNVTYVEPIKGFSTAQQSQIVRFFGATKYKDDICLISDLDMMPLNKEYFLHSVSYCDDKKIVFYSSDAYTPGNPAYPAYPMCYMAAKGSTFEQIIGANFEEFSAEFKEWIAHGYGWFSDEKVFYEKLSNWSLLNKDNIMLLRRGFNFGNDPHFIRRIDRGNGCQYNDEFLKKKYYVDFHMPRPYKDFKNIIDFVYNSTNFESQ
tara:strand:- start:4744 stop:5505 length:762 start_codon:yes stop_codon:yes gene_type:complete